jgi:hypothetical protein
MLLLVALLDRRGFPSAFARESKALSRDCSATFAAAEKMIFIPPSDDPRNRIIQPRPRERKNSTLCDIGNHSRPMVLTVKSCLAGCMKKGRLVRVVKPFGGFVAYVVALSDPVCATARVREKAAALEDRVEDVCGVSAALIQWLICHRGTSCACPLRISITLLNNVHENELR